MKLGSYDIYNSIYYSHYFANMTVLMRLLIKWSQIALYDTKTNYSTM